MRNFKSILALLVTSLSLVACGGSSNDLHAPQLRAVHLSPDAPAVDISVNENVALEDITYRQASGFLRVDKGDTNIKVLVANTVTAVIDANLNLLTDTKYTVIAADNIANIGPIVIEDNIDAPSSGNAAIRVVHGAPSAPTVDIYVSAPGDDFAGLTPTLANVPFQVVSDELEVPAGDYRVRITATGSTDIVYDSGTIALADGVEYIAIAADNIGGGVAPIGLTVLTDSTATPFVNIEDVRTRFRAVHASADAPLVDILVNESAVLEDVPFGNGSDYLVVQPDTYNVRVVAANTTAPVIEADLTLDRGVDYTVAAVNMLTDNTIAALVLIDDNTPPAAGNIKLRLVHAASTAPAVDIYVTAPNADISNIGPTVSGVNFTDASEYLEVPAGTYQVRITVAGNKSPVIDTGPLTLADGQIRTALAVDPAPESTAFGVILLADIN